MTDIYCPIIHGGLQIVIDANGSCNFHSCCLRSDPIKATSDNIWDDPGLIPLRELNKSGQWDSGCWTCQGNELSGLESFRSGSLKKFGERYNLTGPVRIDLMFDTGCNLACRSCGPDSSSFWYKHLKENNIPTANIPALHNSEKLLEVLSKLDLSNLEMVVFCGGETLMGQTYWRVADAIANLVPHSKEKLTVSFQTNGTQTIEEKNFSIIEKFQLVKLHVSLDGVGEQFDYLRWPATWSQVTDNIQHLIEIVPNNVMFLTEETISIFNLYYSDRLNNWINENFSMNRLGDPIDHTSHIAQRIFNIDHITNEYLQAISDSPLRNMIGANWVEQPEKIKKMIDEIQKFDQIRNQDWTTVFPEVANFYSRYLR